MNIVTIQKPAPHCPIPYGHPLHSGYVPADETRIWRTWSRAADDYQREQIETAQSEQHENYLRGVAA